MYLLLESCVRRFSTFMSFSPNKGYEDILILLKVLKSTKFRGGNPSCNRRCTS